MSRWIGVDFGSQRIGLAVGDTDKRIATPLEQLSADKMSLVRIAEHIKSLVESYGAVGVVVGLPINADGSWGQQSEVVLDFAANLARLTGLDVRLWDERLSSFEADSRLKGRLTSKKKKRRQDSLAAAAILEDFLASDGPAAASRPEEIRKINRNRSSGIDRNFTDEDLPVD